MNIRALLLASAFIVAGAVGAQAQVIIGGGGSGGGTPGGATEIIAGNGISVLSSSPCDTSCTINLTVTNNAKTGTSESIDASDGGKLVSASNTSAQAYSIVDASTSGYTAGFGTEIHNINTGLVTLTAGGSSVFSNGLQTLAIFRGQSAFVWSDGTNYQSILSLPVMAADTVLGNFSGTANYPIPAVLTDCNAADSALTYDTATHAWGCNAISASSGVSSITGTAGQITASASTGAVTLSLPANVQTTTLALNACTIGSNAFCASGTVNFSSNLTIGGTSPFTFSGRGSINSPGANTIYLGPVNGASPSAYTLGFQSATGTNTNGPSTSSIQAAVGTGTGINAALVFSTGTSPGSGSSGGTVNEAFRILPETQTVVLATGKFMRWPQITPASSSDTCTTGDIKADANYIYVCTASNTFKRAALSTF